MAKLSKSSRNASSSKKSSLTNVNARIQKKDVKIKERKSKWVEKISRQTEDKLEKAKKPLEAFNFLKRSLEETTQQIEVSRPKTGVVPESLKHVSTKKGRKNALLRETEQFKMVMSHGLYRKNPLGVLQEHLTNTVKLQQSEASKL